jgi:DNA-binding MarR family transcriptional regulator
MPDRVGYRLTTFERIAMDGYIQVPHSFTRDPNLSHTAFRVCLYLYGRQGTNANAWPSIKRIGLDTGMSTRTVQKAVKILKAAGYLCVTRNSGFRELNRYSVVLIADPCGTKYHERKNTKYIQHVTK